MAKSIEKIIEEEPIFFAKEFLDDMLKLNDLSDQHFDKFQTWLETLKDYKALDDPEAWSSASRQTELTINELQNVLKPTGYIARVCVEHSLNTDDLLQHLDKIGLFKKIPDPKKLQDRFKKAISSLSRLVAAADEAMSPGLPLHYIQNAQTRCIVVSEFYDRFDIKHGVICEFHPKIKRLHVRTTLELKYKDETKEPVGIVLTPDTLSELKRILEAAEIEMATIREHIKK